ncbi:DUF4870 family protein [Novispirillum sp. DQ9]|uniref:DUF4870 family protein n=1 Tax=Novispirillum sp. DQ9 TaxID=3398612 RepID=UPI003C7A0E4E
MEQPPLPSTAEDERVRTMVLVSYVLMGVGLFVGITSLVAVIICHLKREEATATIYESHYTWLIRTFWWSLLGFVVAAVTMWIGVGLLVYGVVWVWVLYRVIKGFLAFNDRRPIPDAQAWV